MEKKVLPNIIRKAKSAALDTSCFIYLFEGNKTYGPLTKTIFSKLIKNKTSIVASTLALTELLRKKEIFMNQAKRENIKENFLQTPNIDIVSPDIFICEKAAQLGAFHNLPVPDAIHIATAIMSETDIFITNDPIFNRVKEIKTIILKDYL